MKRLKFMNFLVVFVMLVNMIYFMKPEVSFSAQTPLPKINFSDSSICGVAGLSRKTTYKYNSSPASAEFKVIATTKESKTFDFSANGISNDWSYGNTIVLPVYNVYATGDVVNLVMTKSGSTKELKAGYFYAKIPLDWTGWKLLKIPKSSFKKNSINSWNDINSMFFNIGGWSEAKPTKTIQFYVDSVYLTSNISTGEMKVDMSDPVIADKSGLDYSKPYASSNNAYAHFSASLSQKSSGAFSFPDYCISTDWSDAREIVIRIYNANPNGQKVNFIVNKMTDKSTSGGYWRYSFNLDWNGWKTLSIPVSSFSHYGDMSDLKEIGTMYFEVGGWPAGSEVKENVDFYIESITAKTSEDYVTSAVDDSYAIYAGSKKALKKLSKVTLSNAPEYSDGIIYAPLSLFANLFDASADGQTLSVNSLSMKFTDNSNIVEIGDYVKKLSEKAYLKNSELYVPACDVCGILNIPFYSDGRLAVMGSSSDIDFIKEFYSFGINEVNEQIIQKITFNAPESYTVEDCETIVEKWVRSKIGDSDVNDLSDDSVASKISKITSDAESVRSKLIKTEGSAELFSDQQTTETAHMSETAKRIQKLAYAYGAYGSELYQNETLLEDILYCLEWFYQNRYGEDELNGTGWHSTSGFNWADWKGNTPEPLIESIMIVRKHLTAEQISDYLMLFNELSPDVYSTGANYIHAATLIIGAAALEKNPNRIMEFKEKAEEAFLYVDSGRFPENQLDSERKEYTPEKGHGFYRDGSYIFHTLHTMNGTYGLGHLNSAANLVSLFDGTAFEISRMCVDNLADWIVNSFDSCVYGTRMPRMFLGRYDNPDEISEIKKIVSSAVMCFDLFNDEDKLLIGSIIKKYYESARADIVASVPYEYTGIFNTIVNDEKYDSYRHELSKTFGNIDKVMHRRDSWAIGVSMSSSRMFNYESINNQNLTGWYLGDGRTELILEDEAHLSASSYWKNIDYYRLPGTTVDTQARKAVSVCQGNEYLSSKDFVGGVTQNDKYSTAAMHLESYHNETDFGKDGGSYGGPNPAHKSDLTAKKSYFMFDNEIYCLGAEVNASDNNNAKVLTFFENRPARSTGASMLRVSKAGSSAETKRFDISGFGVSKDWSEVSKIVIPIYSEVANGDYLNIIFSKKTATLDGYYRYNLKLDWKGWKSIEIPVSGFSRTGNISGWSEISSVYFNIGGWKNPSPLGNTKLYISDVSCLNSKGVCLHKVEFSDSFVCEKANAHFVVNTPQGESYANMKIESSSGEKTINYGSEKTLSDVSWLNLNDKIGYYFPSYGNVVGNLSVNGYFEGYINHGITPENKSYAYALLPGKTSEQTKAYAENPDVEILSNTGDVQAVRYNKENITSIVFWNAGTFGGITVSEPMILMLKEDKGNMTLSVSDPTHKLTDATVTFEKPVLLSGNNERVTQSKFATESSFDIDFSEALGSTINAELKSGYTYVKSLVLKNQSGSVISQYVSQNEKEIKAELVISNSGAVASSVRVFAVAYCNDGSIESVCHKEIKSLESGESKSLEIPLSLSDKTRKTNVFIWDGMSLRPCEIINNN